MAGYSATPLLKKLGIHDGHSVLLRKAPADLPAELKELTGRRGGQNLDIVLLFADSAASFKADFIQLMHTIHADGAIWVAWPKKASGIRTDLSENMIRDFVLTTPFVDVKVCVIDDVWSGLKFVIRKELRGSFAAGTHS